MKAFYSFFSLIIFQLPLTILEGKEYSILPSEYRLNGSSMSQILEANEEKVLRPSVGIYRNGKLIAHGVIVDQRGFLLTKASSSVGARNIRSSSNESYSIRIRKRDENTDLALWKIEPFAGNWPVISWFNKTADTNVGSWAISSDEEINGFKLGVISANTRTIGREGGVMGVIMEETNSSNEGIEVIEVLPQAAGDRAGLQIFDRILKVDGRVVRATEQINRIIKNKDPGDLIYLEVNRRGKNFVLRLTLGHRSVAFDLFNRNLLMSGPVSKRKDNFPMVIQHDLPLEKQLMGGGLFDLNGLCLGINIARIDRVTTYALPSSTVRPILEQWLREFR